MSDWEDFCDHAGISINTDPCEYLDRLEEDQAFFELQSNTDKYKTIYSWNILNRIIKKGEKSVRGLFSIDQTVPYNLFYISKKNGKFRRIFSLYKDEKKQLRELIPYLEEILLKNDMNKVNYGFVRNRNCVEHAMQHIGYQYTVSMDLESFFESVRKYHVTKYFKKTKHLQDDSDYMHYIFTRELNTKKQPDSFFHCKKVKKYKPLRAIF